MLAKKFSVEWAAATVGVVSTSQRRGGLETYSRGPG